MNETDGRILALLDEDPERGIALMIETYAGLLWAVCGQYLKEPEDIKECVNDVYLDFYLYRNRYREENGSLKAYLAVIAKRKAIACWKAGQKQERAAQALAEAPLPEPGKSREEKLALEEALEKLPELDQQITA